jgi:hypothetical protein
MKVILFTSIIAISTCWKLNFREFLGSYLKTIESKEFILDKDCLSGDFDKLLTDIDSAIHSLQIYHTIELLRELYALELQKCPIDVIRLLYSDYEKAYRSGLIITNIFKNFVFVGDLMKEYIHKSGKNEKDLGELLGKLTKVAVYGTHNMNFLE